MDISFVIIGKNEDKNLNRTISAIYNLNILVKFEIIYIDSDSTDDSRKIVKSFDNIKIFNVKSNFHSAALARNLGAERARGRYIFFLDGDMELTKKTDLNFVLEYFDNNKDCKLISGKLPEVIYSSEGKILEEISDRYEVSNEIEDLNEPGGFFIVEKATFNKVNGFNPNLKCNEELELYSKIKRISKMIRTNKIECIHHNQKNELINDDLFMIRFKSKYFSGCWIAFIECMKNGVLKEYLSFRYVKEIWIKSILSSMALILFIFGMMSSKYIFIVPLIIILILFILKEKSIRYGYYKYRENLLKFISIIFISKSEINYKIIEE